MLRKVIIFLLAAGLAASPAAAKGGKGKGHGKGHDKKAFVGHKTKAKGATVRVVQTERRPAGRTVRGDRVVVFADRDREVVRTYFFDTYGRGGCPPGLAKKNNGCLPPGQAKKRYLIGRPLARTIVYEPAPTILVQRLTPVPLGYQYVVVDGDMLLLATGTRLVVDAIRHLVN